MSDELMIKIIKQLDVHTSLEFLEWYTINCIKSPPVEGYRDNLWGYIHSVDYKDE